MSIETTTTYTLNTPPAASPMRFHIKKYSYILWLSAIPILISCASHAILYSHDTNSELINSELVALCLPFGDMHVEYIDDTKLKADHQYTDSFLLDAADGLLLYEVMKTFKISPHRIQPQDSIEKLRNQRYSILAHDTASLQITSQSIRELAARCSVDIVVLPYSGSIEQRTIQSKGWRNSSGPGYERPVSFSAKTVVHIQLWNKEGRLLYERIAESTTGKPILYSFLKKEKSDGDIVRFAKNLYAPPLIKSIYASIKLAMRIKT